MCKIDLFLQIFLFEIFDDQNKKVGHSPTIFWKKAGKKAESLKFRSENVIPNKIMKLGAINRSIIASNYCSGIIVKIQM